MKTLKVIGNCCCLFLAIIGALVSIVYGYYQIFVKDYTTGTNYIGDQIPIDLVEKADDLTQEELDIYESRVLFNVNYYSNDKENEKIKYIGELFSKDGTGNCYSYGGATHCP